MYLTISLYFMSYSYLLFTFFWLIEQQPTYNGVGGRQPYLFKTIAPSKTANMGLKPLPKQPTSLVPAFGGGGGGRQRGWDIYIYISFELLNQAGRGSSAQKQIIVAAGR